MSAETYVYSDTPVELAISGKRFGSASNGVEHVGFTPEQLAGIVENHKRMGSPELVIELAAHDSPIAAGFITKLWTEPRGDESVLLGLPKWTKRAAEHIAMGELVGMSIEAVKEYADKRSGDKLPGWTMRAAALLNRPFYDDLKKVSLAEPVEKWYSLNQFDASYRVQLGDALGIKTENTEMKELLERLGKLLGVAADEAAVTSKLSELVVTGDRLKLAEGKVATLDVLTLQLSDANAKAVKLAEENKTLRADNADREVKAFIADGQKAGKIPTKDDAVAAWMALYLADGGVTAKVHLGALPSFIDIDKRTGDDKSEDADAVKLGDKITRKSRELRATNPKMSVEDSVEEARRMILESK